MSRPLWVQYTYWFLRHQRNMLTVVLDVELVDGLVVHLQDLKSASSPSSVGWQPVTDQELAM